MLMIKIGVSQTIKFNSLQKAETTANWRSKTGQMERSITEKELSRQVTIVLWNDLSQRKENYCWKVIVFILNF
jgi:aryl carrier-like protein